MWRLAVILAVLAPLFAVSGKAEGTPIRYYIQLVRGTDSNQPPQAGSQPVGPKLENTLNRVLRWTHYWEICRRKADLRPGHKLQLRLSNERTVEIDLTRPGKRTIAAFYNGTLVDRIVAPVSESMTLIGGDRDGHNGWFIVVRRDTPGD